MCIPFTAVLLVSGYTFVFTLIIWRYGILREWWRSFLASVGDYKHCIEYRHIIDWLVCKPGAFENYRYREDLFTTSRFRMAYDYLKKHRPANPTKEYLKIIWLTAYETEEGVDSGLRELLDRHYPITAQSLENLVKSNRKVSSAMDVEVSDVNLTAYDELLDAMEDCHWPGIDTSKSPKGLFYSL